MPPSRIPEDDEVTMPEQLKNDAQIEEQKLQLATTVEQVQANLENLGDLSEEQLAKLITPEMRPKTRKLMDILGSKSHVYDAAVAAAGATALVTGGPSVEKALMMLGAAAIAGTAMAITEWLSDSEKGKRLVNSITKLMGGEKPDVQTK